VRSKAEPEIATPDLAVFRITTAEPEKFGDGRFHRVALFLKLNDGS
jgi:hypothetical protein